MISGNGTSQLKALAKRCKQLGDTLPKMVSQMGGEALALNRQSFASQRSPEGESWATGRYTSSPMLRRSGKLAGSLRQAGGDPLAFGVKNSTRYAFYHQHGAYLRDSIIGSKGKLKSFRRGPGRKKEGPTLQLRRQGPVRKGRLRGFLAARPIVPQGDVPSLWLPKLTAIADRHIRKALGL